MNSMDNFDQKVELFLRKKLSHEEEQNFIEELKGNRALLERAQVIALTIGQMTGIRSQRDASVIKEISSLDENEYRSVIWSNERMSHFDDLTNRFLKKQMTAEEETKYLESLKEIPALRERAQVLALAVQQMQTVSRLESQKLLWKLTQMPSRGRMASTQRHDSHNDLWSRMIHYAVAASVVLFVGVGGYKYYQYDQTVSLGIAYFEPMGDIYRSPSDKTIADLSVIFRDVEAGDNLSVRIEQLSKCYSLAKEDEYCEYSLYTVDIAWNLAIAYLKDNNRERAVIVLKEIIEDNQGKAIADKAIELLEKIEKI